MATGKDYFKALGKVMSLGKTQVKKTGYANAMSLYRQGRYAEAAESLEDIIGSKGLRGHLARFYHARSCRLEAERQLRDGQFASATTYLRQAVHYNPESCELTEFLARTYVHSEDYGRAGEQFGRLSELTPGHVEGRVKEAMSYFLAGRGERAIELLEAMLTESAASFEGNYYLGMILAAEEQPHGAIPYLTRACRIRPESVDAHWKLGLAKGLTGHLMEAIHHLQLAHKLEPANHWLLAQLTLGVGQARRQGIEVELELASVSETRSDVTALAMGQLSELILQEPEFVTAFLDLPTSEMDEQIFSTLLDLLMQTLERNPEYADLHYHCSRVYDRLGQSDRAIQASQRALEINPRYLNAMIHLAKMYNRTSQDRKAISRLNEAITLGANYADVHYLLGKLYHGQGSLEEARRHYRTAIQINGQFHAAEEALASIAV